MSTSYRTSNQNFPVIIPTTQAQILAINQDLIPSSTGSNGSYAPIRNHHTFSVFSYDDSHDFYFSPNYDYDRNSITEYQQVVIEKEEIGGLYWENM